MQSFSFLHCADVHLGAPFRGMAAVSPALGRRLRDAPAEAFRRIVDAALERRVAAVVVAGDLFDAADRNLRAQIQLRDQLARLDEAGIPTFIAAGNHDPLGGRLASITWPSSVHWFGEEVEAVPLQRNGTLLAHVYGVSYPVPDVRDNLAQRFPPNPTGPFSIAVLHANVGGRPEHAAYSPCSVEELASRRYDYWALGHVHTRDTLRAEPPVVHYPGNPQGLHAREIGPRGATIVEVSSSGSIALRPVWTDAVRWHRRRTAIEGLSGIDDLLDRFDELAGAVAGEAPDRLHIVKWTLSGRGPLHAELRRPGAAQEIVDKLRGQHAAEPDAGRVWLERIELTTRPERDTAALREQQDLLGDLLRLADEARETPPRPTQREVGAGTLFTAESELAAGIREALEELLEDPRVRSALGQDPWELMDWPRLIGRAETLAIEGLADDGPQDR